MVGYTITGFEAGDGIDVGTEDKVVLGGEVCQKKGHPKFHA